MKKLSVIGLVSNREELMEKLMTLGVVEITDQEDKLSDSQWHEMVARDSDEQTVAEFESQISRVSQALSVLEKYGTGKKPLLHTKKPITLREFQKALERKQQIEEKVAHINSLSARHAELTNSINKTQSLKLSLEPWIEYDVPLEEKETSTADIILGVVPSTVDALQFINELEEKVPESMAKLLKSDAEQHYIYVVCLKEKRDDADDVFRTYGFSKVHFGDMKGTVKENISALEKKVEELTAEKVQIEESIRGREGDSEDLELLYDKLVILRDKAAIRQNLLVTKKTFYMSGWLPAKAADKVSSLLEEVGCYYQIEDPEKGEETPVLLLNGGFSTHKDVLLLRHIHRLLGRHVRRMVWRPGCRRRKDLLQRRRIDSSHLVQPSGRSHEIAVVLFPFRRHSPFHRHGIERLAVHQGRKAPGCPV
jgi:V/A-type H+-transporting ATPase subunit I